MILSRRIAVLAAALVAGLAASAPAHAAAPGLNISDYADTQTALDEGAKQVRFFVRWSDFEPSGPADYSAVAGARTPNIFTQGLSDNVRRTLAAGATAILVVLGAPAWAATNGHPRNADEYASFVGELATQLAPLRFGRGTVAYEIWNEPDAAEFWGGTPDPDFYAAMLKASYTAIKAGDPAATVLNGPTTGNDFAWIEALYARGVKGFFDGVSVHTDTACSTVSPDTFYRDPEGRLGQFTFLGYREVRKSMLANGDDKPIWLSELGWSTTHGGPASCARGASAGKKPSGVDEADQAAFLTQAFRCLAQDPYVVAGTWFTLRDAAGQAATSEGANYGLLRRNGSPKPSLTAFRSAGEQPAGPCGDFEPPALSVMSPTEGQQFTDRLDLRAAASDGGGVGLSRIGYAYDGGKKIGNFATGLIDGKSFGLRPWYGSSALALGPHTIEVTGRDKNGNSVTRQVHVVKVAAGMLAATLTTSFKLPTKVRCQALTCSLRGSMRRSAGSATVGGRVAVEWQFKNKKGQFRRLMGGIKTASRPFAFTAKLKRTGLWRVRFVYEGLAPYKRVSSKFFVFRLK